MQTEAGVLIDFQDAAAVRAANGGTGQLKLNVIFTSTEGTLIALSAARELARDLGAEVNLLVLEVVPYPLPLDRPAVSRSFAERRLRTTAPEPAAGTTARIYLCRDKKIALRDFLPPGSWLVVGGRKRIWPTKEQRLARWLEANGHRVIFVAQQSGTSAGHAQSRTSGFLLPG